MSGLNKPLLCHIHLGNDKNHVLHWWRLTMGGDVGHASGLAHPDLLYSRMEKRYLTDLRRFAWLVVHRAERFETFGTELCFENLLQWHCRGMNDSSINTSLVYSLRSQCAFGKLTRRNWAVPKFSANNSSFSVFIGRLVWIREFSWRHTNFLYVNCEADIWMHINNLC